MSDVHDTIAAVATGHGGAIAVIRLSGPQALAIADRVFVPATGKGLARRKGYTMAYGRICEGKEIIDEVVAAVFRAPNSYTGDDIVEFSCHGSDFIRQEIMRLLTANGARTALPGEFTMRAFLAGKMDLSQAEAVADLVSAQSRSMHQVALNQMRGGYSHEFTDLRRQLIELLALLELELDFSEEDVEFADRSRIVSVAGEINKKIRRLGESFAMGNAIKNGIPVAIAGLPNAGKSTLLNRLVSEERAIVSEVPGTTRDVIECDLIIDGIRFRLMDTAGLRNSGDVLEKIGIERTVKTVNRSTVLMLITEITEDIDSAVQQAEDILDKFPAEDSNRKLILVLNKLDKFQSTDIPQRLEQKFVSRISPKYGNTATVTVSAKTGGNMDQLTRALSSAIDHELLATGSTVIVNSRHMEELRLAGRYIGNLLEGIDTGIGTELLAEELRSAIRHIGSITGEITDRDILRSIFADFCIGK